MTLRRTELGGKGGVRGLGSPRALLSWPTPEASYCLPSGPGQAVPTHPGQAGQPRLRPLGCLGSGLGLRSGQWAQAVEQGLGGPGLGLPALPCSWRPGTGQRLAQVSKSRPRGV